VAHRSRIPTTGSTQKTTPDGELAHARVRWLRTALSIPMVWGRHLGNAGSSRPLACCWPGSPKEDSRPGVLVLVEVGRWPWQVSAGLEGGGAPAGVVTAPGGGSAGLAAASRDAIGADPTLPSARFVLARRIVQTSSSISKASATIWTLLPCRSKAWTRTSATSRRSWRASHSTSTSKAKPSTRAWLKICCAAARRNPLSPLWVSSNGSPSAPRMARLKTRLATRRATGPLASPARVPIATGARASAATIRSRSLGL
jgi:hypothetical protein